MEESKRGRPDALDTHSEVREKSADPLRELAQCEAEVGTLLSIIAELNTKMGTLQAPSGLDDHKPQGLVISPPVLLSSPLTSLSSPEKPASSNLRKPQTNRGGSSEVWSELQGVLSSLEVSMNTRRTWAVPQTACDQVRQTQHLTAARERWVEVTQILDEIESEFGITYPSGLPPEERQQYHKDMLTLHQHNCDLHRILHSRQEELDDAKVTVGEMENERNLLQEKLLGLHKEWRSGSLSPPYSPSESTSSGALSPGCTSPGSTSFPGSPLLLRRPTPMGVLPAISPSPWPRDATTGSPCPNPSVSLEGETERLHRCIERLKTRNDGLTAALDRRKGESEQISMTLSRHEAENTALQIALQYCVECEETYSDLLSLYEAKKQQVKLHWRHKAGPVMEKQQPNHSFSSLSCLMTEELSTSFSTPGDAVETEAPIQTRGCEEQERETDLRQRIQRLKEGRAAVCVPKPGPGGEGKLSPDTGTLVGSRWRHGSRGGGGQDNPQSTNSEKAALLYELVSVREEISELRRLIRLTEKKRQCLDWSLMAQKAQDAAGILISESLTEELEQKRRELKMVAEHIDEPCFERDITLHLNQTILLELQSALQREQMLKTKVSSVRDSLDSALLDCTSSRIYNDEQISRLTHTHSKVTGTYRNARRKYREQLWRLENQVSAMSDRHMTQIGALKATLEALDCRREETVL
ncbi:hypothetical protein DPEC_G00337730 [Dallia pectoralis]|uniref:Uncharacterized protein n=1 Tax=Dallia pectoralis TaxID=75939 RepID=A0ACC2F4H2_DALPE|nr:hypothetical protein DPEC_G00337730 [Dallia pectoralis]